MEKFLIFTNCDETDIDVCGSDFEPTEDIEW